MDGWKDGGLDRWTNRWIERGMTGWEIERQQYVLIGAVTTHECSVYQSVSPLI